MKTVISYEATVENPLQEEIKKYMYTEWFTFRYNFWRRNPNWEFIRYSGGEFYSTENDWISKEDWTKLILSLSK